MSKEQEALKLALIIEEFDGNDESLPLELLKPIAETLRALAQPPLPVQDGKCKYCTEGCPACDARKLPVQEPVMYIGKSELSVFSTAKDKAMVEVWKRPVFNSDVALYTTPPAAQPAAQQQPLTEVQIETGRRAPWGFNLDAFTAGAKFAEAAHNIGAKP